MGFSLPLELLTFIGSGILSATMTLWSMSLKAKAQAAKQQLDLLGVQRGMIADARADKSPATQWTKRVLAIMAVFSVIMLPKLAALWGLPPVTVGYTEFIPGFWFLTDGAEVVKWHTATGFVITPLDTHFCSAVAGMYFGASTVKNA